MDDNLHKELLSNLKEGLKVSKGEYLWFCQRPTSRLFDKVSICRKQNLRARIN